MSRNSCHEDGVRPPRDM
eukprot:gene27273-biopygen17791